MCISYTQRVHGQRGRDAFLLHCIICDKGTGCHLLSKPRIQPWKHPLHQQRDSFQSSFNTVQTLPRRRRLDTNACCDAPRTRGTADAPETPECKTEPQREGGPGGMLLVGLCFSSLYLRTASNFAALPSLRELVGRADFLA